MRRREDGSLLYSPSDLIVFMESEFASWMDRFYVDCPGEAKPDDKDPTLAILQSLGIAHEQRYLESLKKQGLQIRELDDSAGIAETRSILSEGPDVIYQAALGLHNFAGRADFLLKDSSESGSGRNLYNIVDTKLALKPKPYFVIQLCCYAEMLEGLQGTMPVSIGVVLGDSRTRWFRTLDYFFYYRQLKRHFLLRQSEFDRNKRPLAENSSDHGRWNDMAQQCLEEIDHLSKVANIRRSQIKKLEAASITTFTQLAESRLTHVPRLDPSTLVVLQRQARLQLQSADSNQPKYEVIEQSESTAPRGLQLLPPASRNDIFFDMEGYPYIEGGLEYLFGASYFEDGRLLFKEFWAHDRAEEKCAFENFVDWAYERWQQDPNMHVYHYADYEVSALRRLMGRHATREESVDALLRNNVFVNLYTVVKQGLCVGTPSYSIKKIELLYRGKRQTEVSTAMDSVVAYHNWLQSPSGSDPATSVVLSEIRDYNKDDCDSTAQLAEWLRQVQAEKGIAWIAKPGPEKPKDNRPPAVNANGRLAQELLADLPEDREQQKVQLLLAHLLEFHWRESKPIFWAKFDRHAMTHEQLVDDGNCLGAMRRTERAPEPVQRSLAYEYSFDATQDTKLDVGSKCFFSHDLKMKTEILSMDEDQGLVQIKLSAKAPAPPDMLSLIPDEYVDPETIAQSIFRIVSQWRDGGELPPAARNLLLRQPPNITGHRGGPLISYSDAALPQIIDVVKRLDGSTLCIQGPPGSGKTFTAAKVVIELLRDGKRVGVTSNSHKAIAKLLREIEAESKRCNFKLKGSKLQSDMADFLLDGTSFAASTSPDYVFGTGRSRFDLVGGTAWTFSDEAAVGGVDYLFVDEAGQVSLANLLAMSPAARNIVLMGDQMQLSQPIQGAHPGDSGQSALTYLLQDKQTVPEDFGIFLATSFRMDSALCEFISSAVYEGRLTTDERAECRKLLPPASYDGLLKKFSGVFFLGVEHEGNTQCSVEEADQIEKLISDLLTFSFEENGVSRGVEARDILVVTPFNMQVKLLKSRHNRELVGTVDKFQGQEAPIVIVSMCASDGSESARGLEFLLSKNRLNVAISRAQCLAIVVGSPRLARTSCRTVEQIALVNLFCRIVESNADEKFSAITC